MDAFTTLTSIAAPLRMINIDTDIIIPKQFLKTIKRSGLGVSAFYDIRYNSDGSEKTEFSLNQPAYKNAQILITGENFGCGSSREHAPWAILDMGIRCILAPSFADIFYNNCFKNGILPVQLPQDAIDALMDECENAPKGTVTVDLNAQTVMRGNTLSYEFEIDSFRKHCLLNGLDDIGLTLEKQTHINNFETNDKAKRPWV